MQEQEFIINQENAEIISRKPAPEAGEIEFLKNYEIKNWEFSPRIYKILAASAIFNILLLLVFVQTNILQARACDSPWVNRVCQVLDTVYVGSQILGADTEFASLPYEKTEIEDAEIVWIDQTGTEPLNYPEGYFALANPESQFQTVMQDSMPGNTEFQNLTPPSGNFPAPAPMPVIPPSSSTLPPQQLPPAASNPITIPDNPIGDSSIPKESRKGKKNKPENKKPEETETAKTETEKETEAKQPEISSLPVAEDIINKKPLQDFSIGVLEKVSKQEVDLTKPFSVVMFGTITKEGKFDRNKSAYLKSGGDPAMVNVAKSAIEAVGDSGLLTYLKNQGVDTIKFELVQDDKQIYAIITSTHPSKEKASSVSSALNFAIEIGKKTVKEEDTLTLLNAATVESKDKNFILNFNMEKPIAHEMIKRQLQKAEEKRKQEQQPNSTAQTKPVGKTAGE